MGSVNIKPQKRVDRTLEERQKRIKVPLYNLSQLKRFKPHLLGIGNIAYPSQQVEAMAAIFDLSGFTNFCKQVDPHLCMPDYLSKFLNWLFRNIRNDLVAEKSVIS